MKKAEGFVPDEGARQNPRKTTKWSGERQSSRRTQNDSQDDPESQKQNKDWEDAEMLIRDLEELKNKWDEQYTRRNQ